MSHHQQPGQGGQPSTDKSDRNQSEFGGKIEKNFNLSVIRELVPSVNLRSKCYYVNVINGMGN